MNDRITRLESIRGVGAMIVLITHCLLVVPSPGDTWQGFVIGLAHIALNGHAALVAFFVISGYVLGLSLDKGAGRAGNYRLFYWRRVFRIYPAHLVSLVFIAIALSLIDRSTPPPAASHDFGIIFSLPLQWVDGAMNALLLRVTMNGIAWSLALEVAVSVVFPILYVTSRRGSPGLRVAVLASLLAVSWAVGDRITQLAPQLANWVPAGPLHTISQEFHYVFEIVNKLALYGFLFYLGLVAGPFFTRIAPRLEGRRVRWLVAFGLFFVMTGPVYSAGRLNALAILIQGLGATIVVFGVTATKTTGPVTRLLDRPFWIQMGTISYSFYLYHFIVHYCIAHAMFACFDAGVIADQPLAFSGALIATSFVVTAGIAMVSYYRVEMPLIAFSKSRPRSRHVAA